MGERVAISDHSGIRVVLGSYTKGITTRFNVLYMVGDGLGGFWSCNCRFFFRRSYQFSIAQVPAT